jgi:hypothetical protein
MSSVCLQRVTGKTHKDVLQRHTILEVKKISSDVEKNSDAWINEAIATVGGVRSQRELSSGFQTDIHPPTLCS